MSSPEGCRRFRVFESCFEVIVNPYLLRRPGILTPMLPLRSTRPLLAIVIGAVLLTSSCSTSDGSVPTSNAPTSNLATPSTTSTLPGGSTPTPATTLAASDNACRPNAGPNVQISWENLLERWTQVDGAAPLNATYDTGTGQDSGQFTLDDGTIVQATLSQDQGEVTKLFVISSVDPQNPTAGLPTILNHWVAMLSLTEPLLTPQERVDILSALGVVGTNLTLLEMNGVVDCGQRAYEVAFDIDLAAFIFGVDLAP